MDNIRVIWINNGDESQLKYKGIAQKHQIDITFYECFNDCKRYIENPKGICDAIVLNDEVKIINPKMKANIDGLTNATEKIKQTLPRFIVTPKIKIKKTDEYHIGLYSSNKKLYRLESEVEKLFEDIKLEVNSQIEKRHEIIFDFCNDNEILIKELLTKLEEKDSHKDSSIPNKCRLIVERLRNKNIFDEELKNCNLKEFSKRLNNANNVPEHIKRSLHSCITIGHEGSHDGSSENHTTNMISYGKAPYLTKSLIYQLLNILYWCASIDDKPFKPTYNSL